MKDLNDFEKIYVLVSGGIDSTYLYEKIKEFYGEKVFPVNCYNPYEQSKTLTKIQNNDPNFIEIRPDENYDYGKILKKAFLQLPKARRQKRNGKYNKKLFGCCRVIKHKAFLSNDLFKQENSVVVSGIKHGDGSQRAGFLSQLRNGSKYIGTSKTPNNYYYLMKGKAKPTYYHKHKTGQLYFYPFRDYFHRELPDIVIHRLRKKYPNLSHSGCQICPVLVLFNLKEEKERYIRSRRYASKLGVLEDKLIDEWL
jgi:hypothetical protein